MTLHNIFVTGNDGVKEWFRQYIRLNQHKVGRVHPDDLVHLVNPPLLPSSSIGVCTQQRSALCANT